MYKVQGVMLLALFVRLAHSWDIVVTAGNRLEFYTNDGDKEATVFLNSRNLTAITYDEVHNMLLYVDKQSDNDAICAYNITSSMEHKCYIEKSGRNIQGLAFDPITEVLFFTDTMERTINLISLKPGCKNNADGNLLINIDDGIPTEIVVDSCRGYIYWINTNRTPSNIERAQLNGLEREVVINATLNWNLHSLAIDHVAQKLYWKMYEISTTGHVYSADFDGKNIESKLEVGHHLVDIAIFQPNTLTLSTQFLLYVNRCASCTKRMVSRFPKPLQTYNYTNIIIVDSIRSVAIATNDKIKDQFKGISECHQALQDYETYKLLNKIANEHDVAPFCEHGLKRTLNAQSLCKCTPGYTGERCEVSVCENTYCFQGNCSITEDGLPICRCNAGYSGNRCEVNECHGYCMQGNCSFNEEGLPKCRCNAGFSGDRCEVNVCHGYCMQGNCSFNEEGLPKCRCNAGYSGDRCEVNLCHGYCMQGNCSFNEEVLLECRCEAGYSGDRCEVNMCHSFCFNNGICSLTEEDEPGCECVGEYEGERCEVPVGLNNGDGALNEEHQSATQRVGSRGGSRRESDKNNTFSTSSMYCLEERERNLTLADVLDTLRKHAQQYP